jgi:mono/diheme cytochrome c family protein
MGEGMKVFSKWIIFTSVVLLFCGCDYGRMKDQEALQTYKTEIPEMPAKTIPVTGGLNVLREANPEKLRNPVHVTQESVRRGKEDYGYYCVMCHGPKGDGNATVGQSFYPLPTDLKSSQVQKQSDGKLFYTITFGLNRHPPLGFMLTETDRWAIIHYIRSLSSEPKG